MPEAVFPLLSETIDRFDAAVAMGHYAELRFNFADGKTAKLQNAGSAQSRHIVATLHDGEGVQIGDAQIAFSGLQGNYAWFAEGKPYHLSIEREDPRLQAFGSIRMEEVADPRLEAAADAVYPAVARP
jgi:hypothetical protein